MPDLLRDDQTETRTHSVGRLFSPEVGKTWSGRTSKRSHKSEIDPKLPVDTKEDRHPRRSPRRKISTSVPHIGVGVEGTATDILDQPESSVRNIRMVEAVEVEEVRRPRFAFKGFYNFLVIFFILLEPLSSIVVFFNNQGHLFLASLIQRVRICAKISGQQVPPRYKSRVKSKDLITGRFLGQGYSGIFYETTWSGSHEGMVKLARKLFPGVQGDIFESEVERLLELNDHPNIVKTFCWTVDNRSCSLVMQYVRDNLSSVMQKKKEALRKEYASKQLVIGTSPTPFPLPEVLDTLLQIAIGVQYLHAEGIAHGDLKPNNVLIDWEDGRMLVKLADFGLIETKRRSTLISQRALGSQMIIWGAPELFEAPPYSNPRGLMTKADSYSFALICAYILGGKVYNANLIQMELRKQIINNGLRPELPSKCPKSLASLISSCWDAEPLHRPTFSDICEKLKEIVKEQREQKDKGINEAVGEA